MKVLVTGANGFTGSYLTRHLLEKGYDVRVLVRHSSNVSSLQGLPVEYVYADLAQKDDSLDEAVRGVDTVYHIAALYRAENVSRKMFWAVNVEGTRRLLDAASRAGVRRFVHCSTVGVQGEIKNPPAREEDAYNPGDHYQESKMAGELLALQYFKEEKIPGTVVRPVGIYGPGDTRFLKLFKHIYTGRFRMIGDGNVYYHLTYVEDLVNGIALAGEKQEALGEVITIGGSEYVTLRELVAKIARALQCPVPNGKIPVWPVWLAALICELTFKPLGFQPPLYRRRLDFFLKSRAFDITKARRLLGYEPKVSLDEGLRLTAEWYKQHGWLST